MLPIPDEDDTPFSAPKDVPELMPDDYPALDSNVDSHEAYDEGVDDTALDVDPYRSDDDPVKSARRAMRSGAGGQSMYTLDHDKIRRWMEARNGIPTRARDMEEGVDKGGLYVYFTDEEPDIDVEEISWEKFFELFDQYELAFLFKTRTPSGSQSRFYEFIDRIAVSRITEARQV